jgi:hypothetical protein
MHADLDTPLHFAQGLNDYLVRGTSRQQVFDCVTQKRDRALNLIGPLRLLLGHDLTSVPTPHPRTTRALRQPYVRLNQRQSLGFQVCCGSLAIRLRQALRHDHRTGDERGDDFGHTLICAFAGNEVHN